MPRERTGTVWFTPATKSRPAHWVAKITLPDGSRSPPLHFYEMTTKSDVAEKRARERAAHHTEKAHEKGLVAVPRADRKRMTRGTTTIGPNETFEAWAKRWCDDREAQGIVSVKDDRARLRDHIGPILGPLPIRSITKDDARRLVAHLDDKIRGGAIGWKTAANIWTLTRSAFKAACTSKRPALVVRDDDPTDKVAPPERGDDRERTYLYPSEFRQLVTCKDVPVEWRRLYVLAAYTLSRAGEIRALRWEAVDLERGVIHFRQASKKGGGAKTTKGGKNRRIPIEPSLRPLLEYLREKAGGEKATGLVYDVPDSKNADRLQKHLRAAGLPRTELYPPPTDNPDVAATWAPLTFHDLRGTGVTWYALQGVEPLVIQQRAGHADFSTTQRYLREAETLGKDAGEPFPPLPDDVLGIVRNRPDPSGGGDLSGGNHYRKTSSGTRGSNATQHGADAGACGNTAEPSEEGPQREGRKSAETRPADDSGRIDRPSDLDLGGVVETALATALDAAAKAGRFDVVVTIAKELEARRIARQGAPTADVVALDARRRALLLAGRDPVVGEAPIERASRDPEILRHGDPVPTVPLE